MSASRLRAILTSALWLFVVAPTCGDRVVAIGDIHGDFDAFVGILREARLIDDERNWIGGDVTLVQTGDFLDRGGRVREVVGLLRSLERQAPTQGGRVVVLFGNHEALNVLGVTRDVAEQAYAFFADERSPARLEASYLSFVKWRRQRAKRLGESRPHFDEASRTEFVRHHPPGYLEYLDAISPRGEIGGWLRQLPTVVRIGEVVYLHAGIPPGLASWSEERINRRVWQEIRDLDACRKVLLQDRVIHETTTPDQMVTLGLGELNHLLERLLRTPQELKAPLERRARTLRDCVNYEDWFLVKQDGPLWFRGYAQWNEADGGSTVSALLDARGVHHFVVGHTPQKRITSRFGGRVFLIDTGMLSSYYRGKAAALEIQDGRFSAIYEGGRTVLLQARQPARLDPTGAGQISLERPEALRRRRSPGVGGVGFATVWGGIKAPDGGHSLLFRAHNPDPVAAVLLGGGSGWGMDGRAPQVPPPEASWPAPPEPLPTGEPAPTEDVEAILDFLRTADIVAAKRLSQGVNQPFKLTLEKDGVRRHAVFRTVDVDKDRFRLNGRLFMRFRDSYRHEVAAFELSRILGLDAVPPTVARTYRAESGSLQLWVENVIDEKQRIEEGLDPAGVWWVQQRITQRVFDALIANIDRNAGNSLIDRDDWTIWLIDHTRSFFEHEELEGVELIQQCERGLWERLKGVDREQVRATLEPHLAPRQLRALFARWDLLVAHFEALLREQGEDTVLFEGISPPRGRLDALSEL